MMFDTSPMLLCTGNDLVCLYWTRPKAAPKAHITMPRYINVTPLTPPKPAKVTCVRSGMLMATSPANTFVAKPDQQNNATIHVRILIFLIENLTNFTSLTYGSSGHRYQPFLAKNSPKIVL